MSANESSESQAAGQRSDWTTPAHRRSCPSPLRHLHDCGHLLQQLALFILAKSYNRIRIKCRASFLLFASSLVVTDLLGHLISGSLVILSTALARNGRCLTLTASCAASLGRAWCSSAEPLFLGSAMAVERCIGVTPIFHSPCWLPPHEKAAGYHRLLPALVAVLPVLLLQRPYEVQISRSFCFFHTEKPKDWLDVFLLCFSLCSAARTAARLRRKHHCRGTSYHTEMICQLLAIMLVSCVCWGPLLVSAATDEPTSLTLLTVVRMATWNQILDPWVYILLRRAVLRKIFKLSHCCWGSTSQDLHSWQRSMLRSSIETSNSGAGPIESSQSSCVLNVFLL
uniref:Prostaglandin F receptor (FP) n=1 Tax=Lates calcarifer TaxID=8187 RepID=A0A4W6DJ16_LATCA